MKITEMTVAEIIDLIISTKAPIWGHVRNVHTLNSFLMGMKFLAEKEETNLAEFETLKDFSSYLMDRYSDYAHPISYWTWYHIIVVRYSEEDLLKQFCQLWSEFRLNADRNTTSR